MATFTELLPETKSEKHGALTWDPASENAMSQVAGVLAIAGARSWCRYELAEFPSGWAGRAFYLRKRDKGSDESEAGYSVFISANSQDRSCSCKGFARSGNCKHVQSVLTLLEAGKL